MLKVIVSSSLDFFDGNFVFILISVSILFGWVGVAAFAR